MNNLIIVPGLAPFKDSTIDAPADPEADKYWVLMPFQREEPPYYIEHIKKGAELLKQDPSSLLMFSGGQTRPEGKKWSEASTYAAIAARYGYWGADGKQIELEEYARDSFENLQFSLYRYYMLKGVYPSHVTVVGWSFKKARFDFHSQTLNIPSKHFTFVGLNNPVNIEGATIGEKRTLEEFKADPFGNHEPLRSKRAERNPFNKDHPYKDCPEIVI
jgi:hypothetical protein